MKKLLSLLLSVLMVFGMLSFATAESAQPNLVIWMMGDKPLGYETVMEKVNEITKDKLGCTVEINFVGWADWATAYSLLLTGENAIDLLYSASWTSYRSYARKGAFLSLDDLVEDNAPELWAMLPEEAWDYAAIDGEIFCIPTPYVTYSGGGIIYRQDLAEKYNLPAPDSLANLTAYMKGIKENCPEMYVNLDAGAASTNLMQMDYFWYAMDADAGMVVGMTKAADADKASMTDVRPYYSKDNEAFMTELRLAKEWADAGYWDRNLEANPNQDVNGFFEQGLVSVAYNGENMDKWSGIYNNCLTSHPDFKIDFVSFASAANRVMVSSPIQDSCVVPITAKNPELAVKFVQETYTNQELFRLLSYGVEGVHYTINDEGCYAETEKTPEFGQFAMNTWCWKNEDFMLEGAKNGNTQRADKIAYYDTLIHVLPMQFAFDKTPVETEIAALAQVIDQYLVPLRYGLSENLDADIDNFFTKAEEAGLSKVQAEFVKQYEAYCVDYGVK